MKNNVSFASNDKDLDLNDSFKGSNQDHYFDEVPKVHVSSLAAPINSNKKVEEKSN